MKKSAPASLPGQELADSGYGSAEYASSLTHLGEPLWLPNAEGWLIRRQIPGSKLWDAIGCYPLFAYRHWELLHSDLSRPADLVSVTAVVDPLTADRAGAALRSAFPDLLVPYKQHFLVDLQSDWPAASRAITGETPNRPCRSSWCSVTATRVVTRGLVRSLQLPEAKAWDRRPGGLPARELCTPIARAGGGDVQGTQGTGSGGHASLVCARQDGLLSPRRFKQRGLPSPRCLCTHVVGSA